MEETLGKRIAAYRKGLGLTQDKLAELLGVTAQAVSKWENDQSCPDISMLPKLAEVFGVTTDEMLGIKKETVHTAEFINGEPDDQEPEGFHAKNGLFEIHLDTGRKGGIGIAIWVLLTGVLLLFSNLTGRHAGLWDILWTTGLLVFGITGLYPKFSFFRLGCGLLGGYYLLGCLQLSPFFISRELLLPCFLLLFGLSLLVDSLRKKKKHSIHFGPNIGVSRKNHFHMDEERFDCATSFGEERHLINLPRLASGRAEVSFGELEIDLSGCEELSGNCTLNLDCSFGELILLVPRRFRLDPSSRTSFGNVATKGYPSPTPEGTIHVNCNVSFGSIELRYL